MIYSLRFNKQEDVGLAAKLSSQQQFITFPLFVLNNFYFCELLVTFIEIFSYYFASFSLRRGPGANVQDASGYSALHHAALNGHQDIVELLLTHEASTNILDVKGSSPLHLAAWAGNIDIVRLLLCHGPSVPNVNLTVSQCYSIVKIMIFFFFLHKQYALVRFLGLIPNIHVFFHFIYFEHH